MSNRSRLTVDSLRFLILLFLVVALTGCSGESETGPGKIRWDRDACLRCNMLISDHRYAVQVRGGPGGEKTGLYKFDDFGDAIIWLEEQFWKDNPRTEIWVSDHRDRRWIDARRAWYVVGKKTPMNYGLGAQDEAVEGLLNFEQAKKHIYMVEKKRFNIHDARSEHLMEESK